MAGTFCTFVAGDNREKPGCAGAATKILGTARGDEHGAALVRLGQAG
jgi:hypothetical protein